MVLLLSGDLMTVFFVHKVYHLLNRHTLSEFVADKVFLLYRASRHVASAIN
jgi:hypothetical protein